MSKPSLFLVVIAGGSGTRFWPKSTSKRPKQLLSFMPRMDNSEIQQPPSLLAQTLSRFDGLIPQERKFIVTTESLKTAILEENLDAEILAEPQGRNTAPCIYWAARVIAEKNPQGVMLVMPADHFIAHQEKFIQTVRTAALWAYENDDLVTLGIQPSRPETGYGYLKTEPHSKADGPLRVEAFVEKPSFEKAQEYVQSGNYFWNGGMFLWRAEIILKAFDQFMPEMKKAWEAADRQIEKAYPQMTATSIDYGIMEKAKNVVTFPLDCGWDDLGSWISLETLAQSLGAAQDGNTLTGGDLLAIESKGNIIDAPGRVVALLGIHDLIVVEQGEVLLVTPKTRAQDIRQLVVEMKKKRPDLV